MPLDKTVNEYKIAWLQAALSSSKTNLIELESLFYSANSGLTPVAKYAVSDHELTYYKTATGTTGSISKTDAEIKFFNGRGATGSSYDDLARNHWRDKPFSVSFVPTQLSGCALWFDAGQITGAVDGVSVATWQDRSGNVRDMAQATASKQPIYRATGSLITPTSKPVVQFDAVDDSMDSPMVLSSRANTFFIVSTQTPNFYLRDSATPICGQSENGSYYTRGTGGELTQLTISVTSGHHVYSMSGGLTGTTVSSYKDGGLIATSAALAGAEPSTTRAAIQAYSGIFSSYLGGAYAEIITYNRVLTTTERQQVESYLKTKYGTP